MSDSPSPLETYALGLIGVILFSTTLCFAILYLLKSTVRIAQLFFLSVVLMSALESPRYILMMIKHDYVSTWAYGCHIFGGYFFFLSLTTVCIVWTGLLELGPYSKVIYGTRGIVVANGLNAAMCIVAFAFAIKANSLNHYFESDIYRIYIFSEMMENLFYSTAVASIGLKLTYRFGNYAKSGEANSVQATAFRTALSKVALTLTVNCCCSLLRFTILLLKAAVAAGHDTTIYRHFKANGILWFCLSDFIPRGLATFVFIRLMASSVSAGSPQSLEQSYRASMKAMNLQRRQSVEEMPPFHVEEEEAAAEDPLETRDDDSVSDFWTSPDAVKNALNQLRSSE